MFALAAMIAAFLGLVPAPGEGLTIGLDAPAGAPVQLPIVAGPANPAIPLILLDPGHGGPDPGAISPGGAREKDVTLALARTIRDTLVQSGRVRVALTRDDDRRIGLRDRFEIARRLGAKLLISLHADAAPNLQATGATVYSLSEVASDKEAAELASRENAAELVGAERVEGSDAVNRILIDLAQRESMTASAAFADLLVREAQGRVPLRPEPRKSASLIVLKAPDIPSILFEVGYLTNAGDANFIMSDEGRKRIATAMQRAIEIHAAQLMSAHVVTPAKAGVS
ncbi:N-acetylmuramoyl-L-alanine amidase family protein [Allosphingosinicella vermicomposti]|uniref:N-acetylmuramoyl-L-alanine amidase family protein n=1 Tax=Allosphingosinicella vermicomposti TaxID=614671 RepID=UPI000D0EA55A|nr:N-acetylmuramoyl-L-alanine amidase [Allosphingosinicella vermicomposti]